MTYANANLAALGLTAADVAPITSAQSGWATALPANVAAIIAARRGGCRRSAAEAQPA